MTRRSRASRGAVLVGSLLVALTLAPAPSSGSGAPPGAPSPASGQGAKPPKPAVRFATFNASLNRTTDGELVEDLSSPDDAQAATVAEIIQRRRPDVLLLNEFDFVPGNEAVDLFRRNYLQRSQHGAQPIRYPYAFAAPVNTGVPSGLDLDNNGTVGGGNDAFGFGEFRGQYGMTVLSRFPIDRSDIRTFRDFLWKDMPGALLPDDPTTETPADWYSPAELEEVRLSSKSHWDVPIRIGRKQVHFLVSHPTPPTFDGAEDRNGTRNHDEIRFWKDYVAGEDYIVDDRGARGGLPRRTPFVIAGDQNSDPNDGDSVPGAIQQLLDQPRIQDPLPTSKGGPEAAEQQGGANANHDTSPIYDTADFQDTPAPGNLRADYVLPSRSLEIVGSGVMWPLSTHPLSRLTGVFPFPSSDHRMVWVDLRP